MSINFNASKATWITHVHGNFQKTVTRIPVTTTEDNVSGSKEETEGTGQSIYAIFYERQNVTDQDKDGLLENADAIILVKPTQTLNKDDKIVYDGKTYQVLEPPLKRAFSGTVFYIMANLFRVE